MERRASYKKKVVAKYIYVQTYYFRAGAKEILFYLLKSVLVFVCLSGGLGSVGGQGIECQRGFDCSPGEKCYIDMDRRYYCYRKRLTAAAANGEPGTPGTDGKS